MIYAKNLMFYMRSSCRTACYAFFLKSWPVLQCICPNSPSEAAAFQPLPDTILPNKPMLLCSVQKEFIRLPVRIPQLINIQHGGLRVRVMDGCR